jgi:hypothetical protein
MKKLTILFALCAASLFAQSTNSCFNGQLQIFNFSGTSSTLIPAFGATSIHVCKIYITTSAATNLNLVSVGSNLNISGAMLGVTAWQAEKVDGAFFTKRGEPLGIASSASTLISGSIVFYREN